MQNYSEFFFFSTKQDRPLISDDLSPTGKTQNLVGHRRSSGARVKHIMDPKEIARQLIHAVDFLHDGMAKEEFIAHRGINADNIFFAVNTETESCKLVLGGFGCSFVTNRDVPSAERLRKDDVRSVAAVTHQIWTMNRSIRQISTFTNLDDDGEDHNVPWS